MALNCSMEYVIEGPMSRCREAVRAVNVKNFYLLSQGGISRNWNTLTHVGCILYIVQKITIYGLDIGMEEDDTELRVSL